MSAILKQPEYLMMQHHLEQVAMSGPCTSTMVYLEQVLHRRCHLPAHTIDANCAPHRGHCPGHGNISGFGRGGGGAFVVGDDGFLHPRRSHRPAAPAARHAELIGFPDELAVAALAVDDHGCLPLTPRGPSSSAAAPRRLDAAAAISGWRAQYSLHQVCAAVSAAAAVPAADAAAALGWW